MAHIDIFTAMALGGIGAVLGSHVMVVAAERLRRETAPVRERSPRSDGDRR